jgi:hypothetical protein
MATRNASGLIQWLGVMALVLLSVPVCLAQKKTASKKPPARTAATVSELEKLRQQYVASTRDYKASLERLLALYEKTEAQAVARLEKSKQLADDGLISRTELTAGEDAVNAAHLKVAEVKSQMASADTQIAQTLVEVETEKQVAKLRLSSASGLVRTTSFIRFTGAGSWVLSESGKLESFFQQTFRKPLPIAVFGQGNIHNQCRLDHRNAMDISLHPDGPEGQALIQFMQQNGIPFSAFRGAIPGVATGPHIHIGRPSHRY